MCDCKRFTMIKWSLTYTNVLTAARSELRTDTNKSLLVVVVVVVGKIKLNFILFNGTKLYLNLKYKRKEQFNIIDPGAVKC